jgi:hypothetical protein
MSTFIYMSTYYCHYCHVCERLVSDSGHLTPDKLWECAPERVCIQT